MLSPVSSQHMLIFVKSLLVFKAARFFSPSKFNEIKPTIADIDLLKVSRFFDSATIDGLKSELPAYLAAAEDVSSEMDPMMWWKSRETELPKWANACKLVVLVQLSSAAAEHVFSILSSSFTAQQESSLEDYIELSIMLQYNNTD